MYRIAFFLVMFAAVPAVAQDVPVVAEPETAQVQQETGERAAGDEVAESAPETFDPTEEVSEDYPIEFPVDI